MVLSVRRILDAIESKENKDEDYTIEVIIPIIQHVRDDDRVFISDSEDFIGKIKNGKIILFKKYCDKTTRAYEIYDDFYQKPEDSEYLDIIKKYKKIILSESITYESGSDGSSYSVYYRYLD